MFRGSRPVIKDNGRISIMQSISVDKYALSYILSIISFS